MKSIAAPAMAAIEAGEAIVTGAVEITPRALVGPPVILSWIQSAAPQSGGGGPLPNDQARCIVEFRDSAANVLGTLAGSLETAGPFPDYDPRSVSGRAPIGTTVVRVIMEMKRISGTENNGSIDDVEVTVDGVALTLTNPDAETGNTSGWTATVGSLRAVGPDTASGSYHFEGGISSAHTVAYQDVSITEIVGDIDASPIRLWGGYGPIEIDGNEYLGIGARGLAQQNGGALGGIAQGMTLSVSGIEPAALDLLDADEIKDGSVVLYRLIFANDGKTLLDAHVFDRGRVDTVETDETIGGDAAIKVAVESAARGLGRSGGRRRADSDQRLIDADDGYFKNTSYAGQKTLYWGGKKPTYRGGG